MYCVFVETSLDTRLVVLINNDDNVFVFKEKLRKNHSQCFPKNGEITISAIKIKWSGRFIHLPDSMIVSKAFDFIGNEDWFIFVDAAVRIEKTKVAACSNPDDELLEKKAEITDAPTLEEESEEKKSKKRKMESSDESLKLCEKVLEVEVGSKSGKEEFGNVAQHEVQVSVPDGAEQQMQYDQTTAPHSNLSDQPLHFATRESSDYCSHLNATRVVYHPIPSLVPSMSQDERDRMVTEVLLKVTDELFDEIANKVIAE